MCIFLYMGMAVWWLPMVWIIPTNQFCTWALEILNSVLWKRTQYSFKYSIISSIFGTGQISLLTYFRRNQVLPRFPSLNSSNIQHKIRFCPMLLGRILVFVISGLTHYINYYLDFSGHFLYVPNWGWAFLTSILQCLCPHASPISPICMAGTMVDASLIPTTQHRVWH